MSATIAGILECEVCSARITDLGMAMIYWNAEGDSTPTDLLLAHKLCGDSKAQNTRDQSAELDWFADWQPGLSVLASTVSAHKWTAEQLRRLALIAWASATQATEAERTSARKFLETLATL